MGGIGNQLFQYYAGLNLANETNSSVDLLLSGAKEHKSNHRDSDIMKLKPLEVMNVVSSTGDDFASFVRKMIFSLCVRSNKVSLLVASFGFITDPFLGERHRKFAGREYYLKGYFQTYKNFDSCTPSQKKLSLKNPSDWYMLLSEEIMSANAVGIHIRRGDYVDLADSFGLLGENYYKRALKLVAGCLENPKFYVFSDDINAAKRLLEEMVTENIIFVEPPSESNAVETLLLMSSCDGMILANSSFSYWGALLGDKKRIVVFPRPWSFSRKVTEPQAPPNWIECESNLRN